MKKILVASLSATLFALLATTALAEDRVDLQTEAAIPKTGNLYGLGVGFIPKTSGAKELRGMVLPIIQANFGERYYISALRAGAWLIDSDDRRLRFGLAADARFGWKAEDGKRTQGMDDRDFSVDIGPALRWQTDYGTVNAQWGFDVGGASKGQTVQVQFVRALVRGPALRLNGLIGASWSDHKMNNYYYGVSSSEATAQRPAYSAASGTQLQIGVNGAYPVGQRGSLLFGLMASRLSDTQADSPIVETRIQPLIYGGYALTF